MNVIPFRGGVEAPRDSGPGDTPSFSRTVTAIPTSRPATDPYDDWLEAARRAFAQRYYAENGDLIDDCREVYRD